LSYLLINKIDLRLVKILEKTESNNCVEDEDDVFCKALAFELKKKIRMKRKNKEEKQNYIY
jgi:hypothetical protein